MAPGFSSGRVLFHSLQEQTFFLWLGGKILVVALFFIPLHSIAREKEWVRSSPIEGRTLTITVFAVLHTLIHAFVSTLLFESWYFHGGPG